MKKLIVKTVALTLAVMVTVIAGVYLIFSAFAPSTLASVYFRINAQDLTVKYSVKAYEKSGDVLDLASLTERVIVFDDDALTVTYATMLINDNAYDTVISEKGGAYHYYVVGSLVESLYQTGKKQEAVDVAMQNTSTLTSGNPIEVVIFCAFDDNDIQTATLIKEKLALKEPSEKINAYLNAINDFLNE